MNPNLNRLQIFREVVVAGSFSKAALVLRQPKSRVSRNIAALERDMGVQLIYRTTRQFQLTEAGRSLFEKAAPLIFELNQSLEEIHAHADEMTGTIRLSVPIDVGSELIGQFCSDFNQTYPKIQFSVVVTNEYVDLVKESIDLALRIGSNKDSSLLQKKIGVTGLIALASPKLIAQYGGEITKVDHLEQVPYLAFSSHDLKKVQIKLLKGRESKSISLNAKFSCNNFFTLRTMTIAGSGISFLPAYLVREAMTKGELVHILKEWTTETSQIQLMFPNQKSRPERIKKFADYLAHRIAPYF